MNSQASTALHKMVSSTCTDYWNDSCSVEELTYAIERGAVGATTNPTIVLNVLKKEMPLWETRIHQLINENSESSEEEIAWKLIEEMAVKGSELLYPIFESTNGEKGRISIQTNPQFYRNSAAIVEQAMHFDSLAPNMQVKIPVTQAGVEAIEETTYSGVNINATVSFTVPQALAVAEAVERGLARREADGKDTRNMHPVCTIMVGRTDDWLQVLTKRDGILVEPGVTAWAGISVFKRAYALYQERGYRTRLLSAAYRHPLHWTEFVGGDVVLTIPHHWQVLFNESGIPVEPRINTPVDPAIIQTLQAHFPDFRRAYEPNGLSLAEFDTYGASVRTLRAFIASFHDLVALIRDFMLPNPDLGYQWKQ